MRYLAMRWYALAKEDAEARELEADETTKLSSSNLERDDGKGSKPPC